MTPLLKPRPKGKQRGDGPMRLTRFFNIKALERVIITLGTMVARPQDIGKEPLYLTPTEAMMLLEAARLGLSRFYSKPSLLEEVIHR
jgi:hypothetical protein